MLPFLIIWHVFCLLTSLVESGNPIQDPLITCSNLPLLTSGWPAGLSPADYPGGWYDLCATAAGKSPTVGCLCPAAGANVMCSPDSEVSVFLRPCRAQCHCVDEDDDDTTETDSQGPAVNNTSGTGTGTGTGTGFGSGLFFSEPGADDPIENNTAFNFDPSQVSSTNGGIQDTTQQCSNGYCYWNSDCKESSCNACKIAGQTTAPSGWGPLLTTVFYKCMSGNLPKRDDGGPCQCHSAYNSTSCCTSFLALNDAAHLIGSEEMEGVECPCSTQDVLPECCERLPCSCNNGTFTQSCCDNLMINLEDL